MKCPFCGEEIDYVMMYAEGYRRGSIIATEEVPGRPYIADLESPEMDDNDAEIECPECYKYVNCFVAESLQDRDKVVSEEEAPAIVKALALIEERVEAQERDVLDGNDGTFVQAKCFSTDKDMVYVKVEFGVLGGVRQVEYTTWWTIDRKMLEIKENKTSE